MNKVYAYTDFREYLRDYYTYMKANTKYFSYRYFSKKAGFISPGWLKFIIDGKRNLSKKSVDKFIEALKLTKNESLYFRALVNFNQANDEITKKRCFSDLLKYSNEFSFKKLSKKNYNYFSKWYHSVIRELVDFDNFQEDPHWISKKLKPRIKAEEAAESLAFLKDNKFVKYNKDKKLVQSDQFIKTDDEVGSLLVRNFHGVMIEMAKKSLERTNKGNREISSLTVSVSKKCFQDIKDKIITYQEELLEMVAKDTSQPDAVYGINFQLFPLTG